LRDIAATGRLIGGIGGIVMTALVCSVIPPAFAASNGVINVPGDQPTIQGAIDAATNGDVVKVAPGTYFEHLDFEGKAITVIATRGPGATVIDGGNIGPVVIFRSGEGRRSALVGFTLQHGRYDPATSYSGGGIQVLAASPSIKGNVIAHNVTCFGGAGIDVYGGAPLITRNAVLFNEQANECTGGVGGGLSVGGPGTQVIANVIAGNSMATGSGGGIGMNATGDVLIANNVIRNNSANDQGGGIWMVNDSRPSILQNLIYGNTAPQGAGVYWSIPEGDQGPLLVNNTIANNTGSVGTAVWGGGYQSQVRLFNNVMTGLPGQRAVHCDTLFSSIPPTFRYNDAWSSGINAWEPACFGQAGTAGNISADPMFVGPGDYHLQGDSPCVDAGENAAPGLLSTDIDGDPRIVGGIVDQGVDEVAL
jgi:parallel beta-helix repeat protein